ncbi:hypothetical protein NMG60_11031020 [Bertholletia excelsa]
MEGAGEKWPHPYVPRDLYLPGFVDVQLSKLTIVGTYALASLLVASLVWFFSGRMAKISKIDRVLMCWWVFTGLTHMIVEGYFVFSPEFYKEKTAFYFSDLWKEYSKGDSRYAARDSAIVAVEGITVVLEGPACLLAMYAIATKKSYSYVLQLAISLGQLYGTVAYFLTAYLGGDNFAVNMYYYYVYYVIMNSFWVLIPSLIVIRCWKKICAAVHTQDNQMTKTKTR